MRRKLAAILLADVVGYSRLMGEDEVGTFERLEAVRKDVVQPAIMKRNGRIVKLMGDGLLAEFPSVVDAVECAVEVQEAMADRDAELPEEQRIRLRIGINVGDIISRGSDIYGDGVNVAARLERLAEPGGICLPGSVRDQLSGKVDFDFEPLGLQTLKNIKEPIAVYRLRLPSSRARERELGPIDVDLTLPERPSIAVLPFQAMSADPEQEFFADGLTEDIITRLSYLRDLLVISRTSTFAFKGRSVRADDVARDLGVRTVLEGSVRKVGNRVRITAQLIDGTTGGHLWAQRFDRDLTDIFAIQDEITRAIVEAMQVTLTDGELATLQGGETRDFDAWEAFHQAVVTFLDYTKEKNVRARHLFERALGHDPEYLDAKVYLAWTYWQDARCGWAADPSEPLADCRGLVDEIRATGVPSANARHQEAATLLIERRHEEALEAAHEAVALGPCRIFGYTPSALVRLYSGELRSAVDLLRTTMRLSPYCPGDAVYTMAYALCLLGDHRNAIQTAEYYVRRVPSDLYAYTLQAIAFSFAGQHERAQQSIRTLLAQYPSFTIQELVPHEPFRNPEDLDRVLEALRTAGLPE